MRSLLMLAVLALSSVLSAYAQDEATTRRVQGAQGALNAEVIINQVDTSQYPKVSIFTTVLKDGEPVSGLTDKDFTVKEDEVDQEPLRVAPKLDPLNAVITLDTSGSIKKALPAVQNAAKLFLDQLAAEDRFQVVTFSRDVRVLGNLGGRDQAKQAIDATVARGDTALYDAIYSSLDSLKAIGGRKAVIILSDGVDDDGQGKQLSKHSVDEGLQLAAQLNVPIFTIGLGSAIDETVLRNVAEKSGGKYFNVADGEALKQVYQAIGKQLGGQYGIYYTSNLPADGTQHRIALSHQGKISMKEYLAPTVTNTTVAAAIPQSVSKAFATPVHAVKPAGLHISTIAKEGGEPLKADRIKVFRGDGAFEELKIVETCYGDSSCSFKVPAGTYQVLAEKGAAIGRVTVTIADGESVERIINVNVGTVNLVAMATEGGQKLSDVKFYAETISDGFSEAKRVADCYSVDKCTFFLNAGSYNVRAIRGIAEISQKIAIEAGVSTNQILVMNAGIVRVKVNPIEGAAFITPKRVKIFGNVNSFEGPKELEDCYEQPMCSFTVTAGEYLLRAQKGEASVEKKIVVAPGGTVDQVLSLNSGMIVVKSTKGVGGPAVTPKRIVLQAPNPDGAMAELDTCYDQLCSFTVPAGKYQVMGIKDGQELVRDLEVAAGAKVDLEMGFN